MPNYIDDQCDRCDSWGKGRISWKRVSSRWLDTHFAILLASLPPSPTPRLIFSPRVRALATTLLRAVSSEHLVRARNETTKSRTRGATYAWWYASATLAREKKQQQTEPSASEFSKKDIGFCCSRRKTQDFFCGSTPLWRTSLLTWKVKHCLLWIK